MPSSWIVLVLLLLLALAGLVAVVIVGLAGVLLRPPRMNDGKAMYLLRRLGPEDLGMPFEVVAFRTRGPHAIDVAGWWVPAIRPDNDRLERTLDRTVVLVHGYGDAKVGALAWAPLWRSLGFNLLLIDLRAHGESGGRYSTAGFLERDDLDAILDDLRAARPVATRQIVLFGVSLGGACSLACAARRDDIAGVVTDSVYADYATAVATHGRLMHAPLTGLLPWTRSVAERLSGARFGDVRPVDSLARCVCPVLLIHGERDVFVQADSQERLSAALRARGNPRDGEWTAAGAGHVLALAADPVGYERAVRAFVEGLDRGDESVASTIANAHG